jgi:hypothetical protein
MLTLLPKGRMKERVARFRQIDKEKPDVHHDALEFPNGYIVPIHRLCPGQPVIVLQLPASAHVGPEERGLKWDALSDLSPLG